MRVHFFRRRARSRRTSHHRHQSRPNAGGGKGGGLPHRILAGSDAVLDAAFKRAGVLRSTRSASSSRWPSALEQPRPRGQLTVVTNAGGPGVLATDSLIQAGGALAQLDDSAMARLNEDLPAAWSHGNPIDILGDATPERYAKAVRSLRAIRTATGCSSS